MNRITWIGLGLLTAIATAGVVFLQRSAIATLRQEHETLVATKAEAERLAAEQGELDSSPVSPAELDALRAAQNELLGLRNEAHQLRSETRNVDILRVENQRLADQIQQGVAPVKSITEMEGFVAKENWANVGLATPETALQAFFWAMREANVQQILACMCPKEQDQLLKELERMPEDERQNMVADLAQMTRGKGYRIADRKENAADQITLSIQFVANGQITRIPLRLYGEEWKIEELKPGR